MTSCILSKFYIKPQHSYHWIEYRSSCILSKFYIKPQHSAKQFPLNDGCILSKFYIKPQLSYCWLYCRCVVSYRNSTSNHNNARRQWRFQQLYLIEILHQTTTLVPPLVPILSCILSKFYIKPQLRLERELAHCSCILSKFYIKPQLWDHFP